MAWYDLFSSFYDQTVERIYRSYRPGIVEALHVRPGDAVLDLACGTGPNHPYLVDAVGHDGRVFGVDFSKGMLTRAEKQAHARGWEQVFLLQKDARELTVSDLERACGAPVQLTSVVIALGLSVIPDWETVFAATFALLPPGGRYVIFDIHAERWVPQTWLVTRMAQADLSRQSWKALESCSENFAFEYLPGSPHIHGGQPFLASGQKAL